MPKFAFNLSNVRVLVEAADADEALNVIDELPGTRQDIAADGTLTMVSVPEHAWLIRAWSGMATPVRTCLVCGCTDDDSCQPRRCSWLTYDLCSTDDHAHRALYEAQGVL